ncbi:MAG: xanthine phosphoribosyltransferase [Alphaproteobacteria bacterium]|nr:xanthine phosphoribosyltransferase [Alphaproteobacteria bacterium]
MTNKIYLTWDEFYSHAKLLVSKIKSSGTEYNRIVAVSRGGLIPAGILAYELDIRNCDTINMASYDGTKKRNDDEIKIAETLQNIDDKTLIVDDLSDSGRTFRILRKLYPQACFVAVYSKEKGKDVVDIFASEMPDNWIVFPWDL